MQVIKISYYYSQHDGAARCIYFLLHIWSYILLLLIVIRLFKFPPRRSDGRCGWCQPRSRATGHPRRSRLVIQIHRSSPHVLVVFLYRAVMFVHFYFAFLIINI